MLLIRVAPELALDNESFKLICKLRRTESSRRCIVKLLSCIACNVVFRALTLCIPASSIACIHHFYTCHIATGLGCMHPHILQPYLEVSSQNQAPAFKDLYGRLISMPYKANYLSDPPNLAMRSAVLQSNQ